MTFHQTSEALMKKRFPEEIGKECLMDLQMNMLDYLEVLLTHCRDAEESPNLKKASSRPSTLSKEDWG